MPYFTKKFLFKSVLILLTLIGIFNFKVSAQTCQGNFQNDTVNVQLLSAADLEPVRQQYNLQLIESLSVNALVYYFRITDGVSPCVKATQLRADQRVFAASPNYLIDTFEGSGIIYWGGGPLRFKASNDGYENQWAIPNINLREAQQVQPAALGNGVTVAVLDTGIDFNHPLFKNRIETNGMKDFVDNDNDPSEVYVDGSKAYGHGTHIAGIIALVAPNAKILPIRVLDGMGIGTDWNLAKALNHIAELSQTNTSIKVMNMSFSTPDRSDVVESVFHAAVKGRTVNGSGGGNHPRIVAAVAAGNNGSSSPFYPAAESVCENEIISVAANGSNNDLTFFSNYSSPVRCDANQAPLSWVNLMAPGYRIISAMPENRFGSWSGTSMAAPFAAGVAALLRSKCPNSKADVITSRLISSASPGANPNAPPKLNALSAVTGFQCQ